MQPVATTNPGTTTGENRIVALDGLRGSLSAAVVLSHFFGEVQHRVPGFAFGWIAVMMFFTLSGFLVGRMILDREHHPNFFPVFYARRACRILPPYILWTCMVFGIVWLLGTPDWVQGGTPHPMWSYLTFTHNFFMASTNQLGLYWISQAWSLGIEEQFYILAPLVICLVPRRWLVSVLLLVIVGSVLFRALVFVQGWPPLMAFVTLPGRADSICVGLIIALMFGRKDLPWDRIVFVSRTLPIAALVLAQIILSWSPLAFNIVGPLVMSIGAAGFILAIAKGAPEAKRFNNSVLQFFGSISYSVFLTHLAVGGLLHGLILGSVPDLATPQQWIVTLVALPCVVLVGWLFSKLVQDPAAALGRRFKFGANPAPTRPYQSGPAMQPV
jgi:peptidoglycan/LPS O-acetylase OafA/YrhL